MRMYSDGPLACIEEYRGVDQGPRLDFMTFLTLIL